MLVLSRKRNESIIISDNIRITVVDIRGDKVRLGIEAPKDVPVHRQEVYEMIHGRAPTISSGVDQSGHQTEESASPDDGASTEQKD